MEETVKETKPTGAKKVLSIIFNTIFYLIIVLLLVFSISNLVGKDKNAPSLFGLYFMNVESGSMEGPNKDSFTTEDLIITKKATAKSIAALEVGDIVTYKGKIKGYESLGDQYISHRIVAIREQSGAGTNGKIYVLQGDYLIGEAQEYDDETYLNADGSDGTRSSLLDGNYVQEITDTQIEAIYVGKWVGFGNVMTFLKSKTGFACCIILPTGILLVVEIFFLIRNIVVLNKEKMQATLAEKDEENKKALEEERERMKQELLAEMRKEQEAMKAEKPEEEAQKEQ